jgi:hypothetical protein
VHGKTEEFSHQILGNTLLIAALIYVAFALIWGDSRWLMIELVGVIIYGLFIRLSHIYSIKFLALGWLLHPLWDATLHLYGPAHSLAPTWYAVACISFDIIIAGYIFIFYKNNKITKEQINH